MGTELEKPFNLLESSPEVLKLWYLKSSWSLQEVKKLLSWQVRSVYHDGIKAENDFVEHSEEFSFLASNSATNDKLSSNLQVICETISVKLDAFQGW